MEKNKVYDEKKALECMANAFYIVLRKLILRCFFIILMWSLWGSGAQFLSGVLTARQDVVAGMSYAKASVKMTVAGFRITDQFTFKRSRSYNYGYQLYILICTDYDNKTGVSKLYENLKVL